MKTDEETYKYPGTLALPNSLIDLLARELMAEWLAKLICNAGKYEIHKIFNDEQLKKLSRRRVMH